MTLVPEDDQYHNRLYTGLYKTDMLQKKYQDPKQYTSLYTYCIKQDWERVLYIGRDC